MRSIVAALLSTLTLGFMAAPAYCDVRELPDFADLVEKVGPSVVNIRTTERVQLGADGAPQDDQELDQLFRRFFGVPMPARPPGSSRNPQSRNGPRADREVPRGVGSGFILTSDGYIVTNSHVVDGASEIYVTLTDKREFKGKVVGSDDRSDIALVKIDATGLPKLPIGDSNNIRVGQWVVAIGSPFGLENTVTAGIVSAKSRETGDYLPFIQTDVAINPGNSGGPLINMRGEAIGVNSQILSESGGSLGIAFAIPIDEAMRVVDELKATGKVTRGRLGVEIRELTHEEADAIGIKPQGALVSRVEKASPAEKAGILPGDIILKFDAQTIVHSTDLPRVVGDTKPGTRSTLQIWRKGATREVPVIVAELESPGKDSGSTAQLPPKRATPDALGLVVSDLPEDKRHELGILGGVEVVTAEGVAADTDLQPGDIIVGINNADVANAKQFNEYVAKLDAKRHSFLLVRRGDSTRYVPIKPAK